TQISRLEQNERLPDPSMLMARFLPALQAEDEPAVAARLLELAAAMHREDAPTAGQPPFKGLYYFDEGDSDIFFGREALTATLVTRLLASPAKTSNAQENNPRFLAIVGASGSGKSSVLRAGVIPALRWHQPAASWPVILTTPTAHPLEALAAQLVQQRL